MKVAVYVPSETVPRLCRSSEHRSNVSLYFGTSLFIRSEIGATISRNPRPYFEFSETSRRLYLGEAENTKLGANDVSWRSALATASHVAELDGFQTFRGARPPSFSTILMVRILCGYTKTPCVPPDMRTKRGYCVAKARRSTFRSFVASRLDRKETLPPSRESDSEERRETRFFILLYIRNKNHAYCDSFKDRN